MAAGKGGLGMAEGVVLKYIEYYHLIIIIITTTTTIIIMIIITMTFMKRPFQSFVQKR